MRTINPSRVYTRHEYCQILNEAYRSADDSENVRVEVAFHYDNMTIYRIHFYDIDGEFVDFRITVCNLQTLPSED